MSKVYSWSKKYKRLKKQGGGGNADVYFVENILTKEKYALKELRCKRGKHGEKTYSQEMLGRFQDEIFVLSENASKVPGILPVIESSIDEHWYTMPIAQPIMDYIKDKELVEIVMGVVQLTETLGLLHNKQISHRDIKPANIYYYQGRFTLGDFGLVDFPEKFNDYTRDDRGLGAIFTIAPEMKRNPKMADGRKADVFSLAKTMWMFLTQDERGFDGVYDYLEPNHSLRYYDKYKDTHLVEIDELLKKATNNDPDARPDMNEFRDKLKIWLDIYKDRNRSQVSDWKFLNKQLFGKYPPESCSWRNKDKIVEVLNIIGKTPAYNHMFFHDRGGLDFERAENAAEKGCIKLYDTLGDCYIVKPKILFYEGFDENYRWNYFLLELDDLVPIFEKNIYTDGEYLVEDIPAQYVSAQYSQYGVYDYDTGEQLPEGYKVVYRYLKGKFLIVLKSGPYNAINATYDGRHGDCSASEFKEYICTLITKYQETYNDIKQHKDVSKLSDEEIEYRILNLKSFSKNPFKKEVQNFPDKTCIEKQREYGEQCEEYIEENYNKWNFKSIMHDSKVPIDARIKFVFNFEKPREHMSLEKLQGVDNYLSVDGHIKKLDLTSEEGYGVYTREEAIQFLEQLKITVSRLLEENDLKNDEEYEQCFSIKLTKMGKPIHLFTKEEIRNLMEKADDRYNNQLVIDENGYAKVITNYTDGYLYPVRHEIWQAGNIYVGKYSELKTLEDDYISSLQGWLLYLKTGKKQYMDYVHEDRDEAKLLEEIKKFY